MNKMHNQDSDHIYVNATYTNNSFLSPNDPTQYVPATLTQTRDSAFVTDPDKYNITIARFSISSDYVARVFQPVNTTAATGPNQTTWWVGLSYNNIYYDVPIVIPTQTSENLFPVKSEHCIFGFIDLINQGYAAASTLVTAAGGPTGFGGQVVMTYDPVSGLYDMNSPSYYGTGDVGVTGAGIGIHMSFFLYRKFQSFDILQNAPLLYNNHDVTFRRRWFGNNLNTGGIVTNINTFGVGLTGPYMVLKQDKAWPSSVMTVNRLIITTSSLPIYSEYKGTLNYTQFGSAPGNQQISILTDFFIGQDADLQAQGENYRYTPDQYRLTSLKGCAPLTQFDISVYGVDADGTIFQIFLRPGGSMDVKFLFLLKGLQS